MSNGEIYFPIFFRRSREFWAVNTSMIHPFDIFICDRGHDLEYIIYHNETETFLLSLNVFFMNAKVYSHGFSSGLYAGRRKIVTLILLNNSAKIENVSRPTWTDALSMMTMSSSTIVSLSMHCIIN